MNEVTIFNSPQFGQIRTLTIDGEPWFVGKDVAIALGYDQPHKAIQHHVDVDDGMKHTLTDSMGRKQEMNIINESGLYSLIMSSKLPEAKKFKHWVTSEVLPAIRKTGGYYSGNIEEIITKTVTATATAVVTEVIKQIIPLMQNVNVNKTVSEEREKKTDPGISNTRVFGIIKKRYQQPNRQKIVNLPEDVKKSVDDMIVSGNFSDRQIADFINDTCGTHISNATVWSYKNRYFIMPESGDEIVSYEQITMK